MGRLRSVIASPKDTNPLLASLRTRVASRSIGYSSKDIPGSPVGDDDRESFDYARHRAFETMLDKPDYCYEHYSVYYDKLGDQSGHLIPPSALWERYIWYRVNPWKFAITVLGKRTLSLTASAGKPFDDFTWHQKRYLQDLCDPRKENIHARCNRGGSKTLLAAIGVVATSVFVPRYKSVILAGSEDQAMTGYGYMALFFEQSKLGPLMLKDVPLRTNTQLKDGGYVKVLTASQTSVRSGRHDWVYIDEACMADPDIIDAGMGCNVHAAMPKTVLTSTPNKLFHIFREIDIDREGRGLDFVFHHWSCYDCPWITEDQIAQKKRIYDANTFRIEMLGEYGSATGTVFGPDSLEAAHKRGMNTYKPTQDSPWLLATTGVDWGWNHPTVSTVCQVDGENLDLWLTDVYSERFKPMEYVVKNIYAQAAEKGVSRISCDASHPSSVQILKRICSSHGIAVVAVPFNKFKDELITFTRALLEAGKIGIAPHMKRTLEEMSAYHYKQDKDDPEKIQDDFVDSAMLSIWSAVKILGMEYIMSREKPSNLQDLKDSYMALQSEDAFRPRSIDVYDPGESDSNDYWRIY